MRIAILTVMLLCLMCACSCQVNSETRAITNAGTCIAVYDTEGMFHQGPYVRLIAVIWLDGKVIWSKDQVKGGAPYYAGKVPPEKIRALIAELNSENVFANKSLKRIYYGPDAAFTNIQIKQGNSSLMMSSWHELGEAGGGAVSTHAGIESLNGRKIDDVLKQEPNEYQEYRSVWKSLRERISALIPATGDLDKGEVKVLHGDISWVEPSNAQKKSK